MSILEWSILSILAIAMADASASDRVIEREGPVLASLVTALDQAGENCSALEGSSCTAESRRLLRELVQDSAKADDNPRSSEIREELTRALAPIAPPWLELRSVLCGQFGCVVDVVLKNNQLTPDELFSFDQSLQRLITLDPTLSRAFLASPSKPSAVWASWSAFAQVASGNAYEAIWVMPNRK